MQELIISYPRNLGNYFRIRDSADLPGQLVQSISGQSLMLSTDNQNGRLHVLADVEYSQHVGKLHAKLIYDGEFPDITISEDAEVLDGYLRICFRRQNGDWRIKVESAPGVSFVSTYEGIINHDWYDETPHLYHLGKAYLYDGKAVLLPNKAERPDSVRAKIDNISVSYHGMAVR